MADDVLLIIAPCTVVIVTMGLVFGSFILFRYWRHEETMRLIEKGLVQPGSHGVNGGGDTMRWGVIITVVGLALCVGIYPLGYIDGFGRDFPLYFGPWMLIGLLPTFFGIGLLIIHGLNQHRTSENMEIDTEWESDETE
jgi:hypothetical protein